MTKLSKKVKTRNGNFHCVKDISEKYYFFVRRYLVGKDKVLGGKKKGVKGWDILGLRT